MSSFKNKVAKKETSTDKLIQKGTSFFDTDESYILDWKNELYDLDNEVPLPLEQVKIVLERDWQKWNRLSAKVIFTIYFIHYHWESFYKREDSFKDFIRNVLGYSRGHTYDLIKIVNALFEWTDTLEDKKSQTGLTLLERLSDILNSNSIYVLKTISQIKDNEAKFKLINQLAKGEKISRDNLKDIITKNRKSNAIDDINLELKRSSVYLDDKKIVTFYNITEEEKNDLFKYIRKYYQKRS